MTRLKGTLKLKLAPTEAKPAAARPLPPPPPPQMPAAGRREHRAAPLGTRQGGRVPPAPSASPAPAQRHPAVDALYKMFPALKKRKPLAIGIGDILRPMFLAAGWTEDDWQVAIRYHVHGSPYLRKCLMPGAQRHGADGKPCGEVSAEHAARAKKILKRRGHL